MTLSNEAALWKAKYDVLASQAEEKHVLAAEQIVRTALEISPFCSQPFSTVVSNLAYVAHYFANEDNYKPIAELKEISSILKRMSERTAP